jgi:hypothetical protein
VFHPDSYGYRPGRSALDAVGTARKRCWDADWVIDLDIKSFFDSLDHDLVERAVAHHTDLGWVRLYIARWLRAPVQRADGTIEERTKGTPQGGVVTPPTQLSNFNGGPPLLEQNCASAPQTAGGTDEGRGPFSGHPQQRCQYSRRCDAGSRSRLGSSQRGWPASICGSRTSSWSRFGGWRYGPRTNSRRTSQTRWAYLR